jgi:RNA polymerase sigma-70 factor (ECF subfamily)
MSDAADRLYEHLLVVRCQTGDPMAFAELVARYRPRLRYFVTKLLGPLHDSDDVLQEVWLDVFRGVAQLEKPGAITAWLYRLARDRCFRILRRGRLRAESFALDELVDPGADLNDFRPEEAARVHAALDRLAPEHREVLVLRFLEEMSYDDVARVTSTPLGTVRSRIHYAKRALRRILEGG